ncbi:MAG TPA: class I SAM-dependent methyltransferase [Aeromicrobium sp.]|nr:class I SAM-dependent methyltransferase [Aeromicrobium sp.]
MRLPKPPRLSSWDQDPAWATFYDWTVEHAHVGGALWKLGLGSDLGELYRATAEIGDQPAGAAVLDIPCGGGVALRGLRPGQGVRYVAADISPAMLERTSRVADARGVSDQVELALADVHDLQFADDEFDLVVSFTGLHCFPRPRDAVLELARVTREGGTLLGSTLLRTRSLRAIPIMAVGRRLDLLGPGVTPAELPHWLDEAGFRNLDITRSGPMAYFRATT